MTGSEQVLIEDWCQQYPSHSVGSVEFGRDGALYASAGDGASFNFVDYGQDGSPVNPCGDPPGGAGRHADSTDRRGRCAPQPGPAHVRRSGRASTAPSSASTRPRVPPSPTTRWPAATDPNARRIIASGLRNPFRFTDRPGTDEIWVGDVGWNEWEEINRITDRRRSVENFGWPCYEGAGRQTGYDGANLNICENLYAHAGGGHGALLRLPPQQPGRAERELPDRKLLDRGTGVRVRCLRRTPTRPSTTALCSSPTTPVTASGSCRRVPTDTRHPAWSAPSSPAPPIRSTWRTGLAATCSTSTSTAAPSGASATSAPTRPRWPSRQPLPPPGRAPHRHLRRHRLERPRRATR